MNGLRPKATYTGAERRNAEAYRDVSIEDLEAMAARVKKDCVELKRFPYQGDEEVVGNANTTSKDAARFGEMVLGKALNSEQDLRRRLEDACQDLDRCNRTLVRNTNTYLGDKDKGEPVTKSADEMIALVDRIMDSIRASMKATGAIEAAAQAISGFIDAVRHKGLPPQMIELAEQLVDLFKQLAEAARNGDAPKIISVTKLIAQVVMQIVKMSDDIANGCPDKKLRGDVYTGTQALKNFGTQLKIVAAVKAAAVGRDDRAAENQVIACCNGIRDAMNKALHGSAACSIRR